MHIHILGICGTFMGGLAIIAKTQGHKVTGSDANVYPPMSTQLEQQGITLYQGFDHDQFEETPDIVVVGNAMSRGNPAVEYVLDNNIPYTSGPQWLLENVLKDKWVLAVSGTHGKTTTSSMLAWILESAGYNPGFLIGGVPENFGVSARLTDSDFFVIEADEYDSAFFDKRSKFVHYRPKTLIINNIEFDHADIFDDLKAIQRQFHHLMRMVPSKGLVLVPEQDRAIEQTLEMGLWSEMQKLGRDWQVEKLDRAGSQFRVAKDKGTNLDVSWSLVGNHNVHNGVMAIAAAHHVGVPVDVAASALSDFVNVKRRMELKADINNICIYDDFAHHPTAIKTTLEGLRARVGQKRILAVLEPRSNTMKAGYHKDMLPAALSAADENLLFHPEGLQWSFDEVFSYHHSPHKVFRTVDAIVKYLVQHAVEGDQILIMSNGGFGGIHGLLETALKEKFGE